jgi:catalase
LIDVCCAVRLQVWPHSQFPLQEVGRMVLDRNPGSYFAEVEQLAFSPAHLVPGVEPSPDKMLQARLFSYADTHRHRLGVNYQSIPVNCPFASRHGVANFQRDGVMRVDGNQAGAPNYFPNSFSGPCPAPAAAWHKEPVCPHASAAKGCGAVARYETGDQDNFTQCGLFFRKVLTAEERERLTDNIAGSLVGAQDFIQARAIANFAAVDADYGRMVKQKVEKAKRTRAAGAKPAFKATPKLSPPRDAPAIPGKRSNL